MRKENLLRVDDGVVISINDQMIDDIMVSALEGGINYWCGNCKVVGEYLGEYASDQISRGGRLKLRCRKSLQMYVHEPSYTLTKYRFLNGVKLAYKYHPKWFEEKEPMVYEINDRWQDAIMADCIVQYAIFGDIIFG